jgi:micrococcal nuclease
MTVEFWVLAAVCALVFLLTWKKRNAPKQRKLWLLAVAGLTFAVSGALAGLSPQSNDTQPSQAASAPIAAEGESVPPTEVLATTTGAEAPEGRKSPPAVGSLSHTPAARPALTTTPQAQSGYYPITEVVDGDTIKIRMGGKEETLRLIGMDTPETVDPRKPVQCFGKEASNEAKKLLSGHRVRLEMDPTQGDRDKYGRMLAYAYRDDGLFYNEYMIRQGYAHEYTYDLPYTYQADFKAAQRAAEAAQLGLWSPATCNGDTTTPSGAPSAAGSAAATTYYTSSYHNAQYYYPAACEVWKALSPRYLKGFDTLAELLAAYPSRTESPECQP